MVILLHMNLIRKTFLCTEKQMNIIQAVKEKYGLKTETAVFDMALQALYARESKYGEDILNNPTDNDSPEILLKKAKAKADAKLALKNAEEAAKLKPKIDICLNGFGGEIETDDKGFKYCRFKRYSISGEDTSQKIPLAGVSESLIENNVFMPDRATVFKKRPDIKKLFDKLNK